MSRTKVVSDEAVIAALLSTPTLDAAAQQCGLSVRQLYERRQAPGFEKKLRKAQSEALSDTARFLQHATGSAAATLLEIAESKVRPAQVRISAARTILEQATKYSEITDIQARLEALERYAEGADNEP